MTRLFQLSAKSYLVDVLFAFVLLTHLLEYDVFREYNPKGIKVQSACVI